MEDFDSISKHNGHSVKLLQYSSEDIALVCDYCGSVIVSWKQQEPSTVVVAAGETRIVNFFYATPEDEDSGEVKLPKDTLEVFGPITHRDLQEMAEEVVKEEVECWWEFAEPK